MFPGAAAKRCDWHRAIYIHSPQPLGLHLAAPVAITHYITIAGEDVGVSIAEAGFVMRPTMCHCFVGRRMNESPPPFIISPPLSLASILTSYCGLHGLSSVDPRIYIETLLFLGKRKTLESRALWGILDRGYRTQLYVSRCYRLEVYPTLDDGRRNDLCVVWPPITSQGANEIFALLPTSMRL